VLSGGVERLRFCSCLKTILVLLFGTGEECVENWRWYLEIDSDELSGLFWSPSDGKRMCHIGIGSHICLDCLLP